MKALMCIRRKRCWEPLCSVLTCNANRCSSWERGQPRPEFPCKTDCLRQPQEVERWQKDPHWVDWRSRIRTIRRQQQCNRSMVVIWIQFEQPMKSGSEKLDRCMIKEIERCGYLYEPIAIGWWNWHLAGWNGATLTDSSLYRQWTTVLISKTAKHTRADVVVVVVGAIWKTVDFCFDLTFWYRFTNL